MRIRDLSILLAFLLVLWLPASSHAQTANQASRLGWTEDAPSLGAALGLVYEASFNGGPFTPLLTFTCTGAASPFQCSAPLPSLTQGGQTVVLRAVAFDGPTRFESPLSAVFAFTYTPFVLPAAPSNLRITG